MRPSEYNSGMGLKPVLTPKHVRQVRKLADTVHLTPLIGAEGARRGAATLICVIRDEQQRLDSFLTHYRALGIEDFRFIDNGSVDDSVATLGAQPDCTVYAAPGPFSWQSKQAWIHALIQQHDPGGWYVVVDADEKLVYADCEQHALPDLIDRLEARGLMRIRALMVDLYPRGPLLAAEIHEPHCWFDPGGYLSRKKRHMPSFTGGPRYRAFQFKGQPLDPELTKFPLFKAAAGDIMSNPHHHYPYADNFASPCLLGVLHEKFSHEFRRRVNVALQEGQYWNDSAEYRAYSQALEKDPRLSLWTQNSQSYEDSSSLVANGLIEPVDWSDFA